MQQVGTAISGGVAGLPKIEGNVQSLIRHSRVGLAEEAEA